MNQAKEYLQKSIIEFNLFNESAGSRKWETEWNRNIIYRLNLAISQMNEYEFKNQIKSISRSLLDCGPDIEESMPSFNVVLLLIEKSEK